MSFNSDLAAAEMWPIKAKGAVTRLNPLGDPQIETNYHKALEQGRLLEQNIADAQHWLLQKKKDLMEKINMYTNMNNLAINGKLSTVPRAVKYAQESITIIKAVSTFQKEIVGLISAVTQNIGILQMMENNMVGMAQKNLNALALTLNEICNWGLPNLPSIPNYFSDTIWHWNGFQFAPLSVFASTFKNLKFDTNFAFKQCHINTPNLNIFSNYPSSITTPSGLTYGTSSFFPPLGGIIPNTNFDITSAAFVSQMQNTNTAVYLPPNSNSYHLAQPFNTNSSMQGAVPNPNTVISNYQMPSITYKANIVSIVPSLTNLTVEPTDSDYSNPNLTVRNPTLQKALATYVTLSNVVDSNYDPNLTAAWLFYIESTRNGRLGSWLENYQVAYVTYISPSINYLANNPTPWNCVLPSTQINDAPTSIPLISSLTSVDSVTQGDILWQLSYIEASLLGYVRSNRWDSYANSNYISSFTGTDLDYKVTTLDSSVTTTLTLGEGTAEYPTPCTFPSAIGAVLQEVIALATLNIQNTPSYVSNRPQFNYIFNQFAESVEVDRFTQFWRNFNANLQSLLLQDPYLVQFVVSYVGSLDSAIDPLGDVTIYNQLTLDAATRNRTWVAGYPLLPIPVAPIVTFSTANTPANNQNGWSGGVFDPTTFLERPDIQQLPIPTQIAMLRTNLSYSNVQQMQTQISSAIQDQISQNQALLQDFMNIGWSSQVLSAVNAIPTGTVGALVSFDSIEFDYTGNVTSSSTFTIQTAGNYLIAVELDWGAGAAGTRTAALNVNGGIVTSSASSTAQTGPTTLQLSAAEYFNVGDILTVSASHALNTAQNILAGSYISATLTDTTSPTVSNVAAPANAANTNILNFIADTNLASLVAVYVKSNGNVAAIDPITVVTDTAGNKIFPIVNGVSLSSVSAGSNVTVGNGYGFTYQVSTANFTVGGLIYAGAGGVLSQNYDSVVSSCAWIIVVGRAISPTEFVYMPQIPSLN